MSAIEFSAQAGKTFSVQLYSATTGAPIGAAITGVTDGTAPTLYRASTGSNSGIVYVVATATNLKVAGFANLDKPAASGFSAVLDSYAAAIAGGAANVIVTPLSTEQTARVTGNNIDVKTSEQPLFTFTVEPMQTATHPT